MNQIILLQTAAPLATITLNRPERHNSLIPELLQQLIDALTAVKNNSAIRVVLLQANGRSFSTGGDVQGFYDHRHDLEAYAGAVVGLLNEAILAMIALPVPIVTAVHGLVTGGSLGLLLASDIVLIASQASITPYYSVVGFSPDGGWTAMLPQIIGRQRSTEILMTNGTLSATTAVTWGIANRLVAADQIRSVAHETALTIAQQKSGTVRRAKQLLCRSQGDLAERLEAERIHFVQQIGTEEAQAGMAAFLGISE